MKINKRIAIASVSAAAIAGLGIPAGIAFAAPAAQAAPPAKAQAHVAAKPKRPAARKTDQWVTVRAGQTLKTIAAAHHMSWEAIYATPPNTRYLRDHKTLAAGVHLRLPADPKLRKAQYVAMEAAARRQAARDRAAAAAAGQATQPAAQAQPATASQPANAGMSAFEQCVAWRESGDNPTASSAGLFGILPATWQSLGYPGTAGQASVAVQKAAFAKLYAQDGTAPWAPYDGC
ncbi:MAG: LysM peptidoglycan-binding domain-containing protein [Streptosporangiaceae bacterium]